MELFVEPKVRTIRGRQVTRWELACRQSDDDESTVAIGDYGSKSAAMRASVTHPDRPDHGVVVDSDAPAWTPNELTVNSPDIGMVKVRWSDSVDVAQLYWEYADELRPTEVGLEHQPI